jgi:thioredoxin-related protein
MIKIIFTICILFYSTNLFALEIVYNNIDTAKRLSLEQNKELMIVFGSSSCPPCRNLKKDIIDDKLSPEIDDYIVCYIDIDINENEKTKTEYEVSTIPDTRLYVKNRKTIKLIGYSLQKFKDAIRIKK